MSLTFPAGTIRTHRPGSSQSYAFPWQRTAAFGVAFVDAERAFGVPAGVLAAMSVVESDSTQFDAQGRVLLSRDDGSGVLAEGIMQVKPRFWQHLAPGADANTATGNIRLGAAIMAEAMRTRTWQRAIAEVYHPGTDPNSGTSPAGYVATVEALLKELHVTDSWQPVIYNLRNTPDAARFGLARWQADTIIGKCYPGRNGLRPEVIVLHVQEGWTSGSLDHWLTVSASSTVMVQQDGSILKVIAEADGPWTNGDVDRPALIAQTAMNRFGRDLNPVALTIEAEDGGTRVINAAQRKTILWLCGQWIAKYPQIALPDDILGHYQINSVVKANCGLYRDDIAHALADGETPTTPPAMFVGLPAWLPEAYFKVAFPLADPSGVVTRKVIEVVNETGRVPIFLGKLDVAANANVWRFEGFNLMNEGSKVWREGEAPS